jgi:hypothetical protein
MPKRREVDAETVREIHNVASAGHWVARLDYLSRQANTEAVKRERLYCWDQLNNLATTQVVRGGLPKAVTDPEVPKRGRKPAKVIVPQPDLPGVPVPVPVPEAAEGQS